MPPVTAVHVSQSELVTILTTETPEVFFSVCALSALVRALSDPTLQGQYSQIATAIIHVLRLLGPRSVDYLRPLMPDFIRCVQHTHDLRVSRDEEGVVAKISIAPL